MAYFPEKRGVVQPSGYRHLLRWEVYYSPSKGGGIGTHTLHMTKLGARLSRWFNDYG